MEDQTIFDDIRLLIQDGVTSDTLAECDSLAELIDGFDCGKDVSTTDRTHLLEETLWAVADHVRQEAFEQYDKGDRAKRSVSQAAAMTELLGLAREDFEPKFDRVWRFIWKDGKKKPQHNSKLAGDRRLRAAVWMGLTSTRAAQRDRYGPKMLQAFAEKLDNYLRDPAVRTRLTARLHELSAVRATAAKASDRVSVEETHQPIASIGRPVPRHPRVEDPDLWPVLRALAKEVRQHLDYERGRDARENPPITLRWSVSDTFDALDYPPTIRETFGLPADKPFELPDTVGAIADMYRPLRSGRLVVLGKGGAGKSTFASKLAASLLDRDTYMDGDAVPVIFDISAWNPREDKKLWDWLAEELARRHPSPRGVAKRKQNWALELLNSRYVVPLLDRFDEIAPSLRSEAIRGINESLPTSEKLVLLSRPDEYRQAIESSGVGFGAAVMTLAELTIEDLKDCLPCTNPSAWQPILEFAEKNRKDVGCRIFLETLSTPLMVMLARTVYQDADARPGELLEFPDAAAMREHLFDKFIDTAYKPRPQDSVLGLRRYGAEDARRWLGFLAAELTAQGTSDFVWWRRRSPSLRWLEHRLFVSMLAGTFLLLGLAALLYWPLRALPRIFPTTSLFLAVVLLLGAIGLLYSTRQVPRMLGRNKEWHGTLFMDKGDIAPVFFVVINAAISMSLLNSGWPFLALAAIGAAMLLQSSGAPTSARDPETLLRSDRTVALSRYVVFAACAIVLSMLDLFVNRSTDGIGLLPVPLTFNGFFLFSTACGSWYLINLELARLKLAPWPYMRFLADARTRGVLRSSGGAYQFRHIYLQEYLAQYFVNNERSPIDAPNFETKLIALRSRSGSLNSDAALARLREIAASNDSKEFENMRLSVEAQQQIVRILTERGDYVEARKELMAIRRSGSDVEVELHHQSWLLYIETWRQSDDDRVSRALTVFRKLLLKEAGRVATASNAQELLRDIYEQYNL